MKPPELRGAVVVQVEEQSCELWTGEAHIRARYAPQLPTPRTERISPGHLVAIATAPDGSPVVLWRWYDAVVVGHDGAGSVQLWEPVHGVVTAAPRPSYTPQSTGSRAYASAGLPGADWWVAAAVTSSPQTAAVELDAVAAVYSDNDLWDVALSSDGGAVEEG